MSELPYEIAQGHQLDRASADQGLRLQAQPVPAARREPPGSPTGSFLWPCRRHAASVPRLGERSPTEAARSPNIICFPVSGLIFCATGGSDPAYARLGIQRLWDPSPILDAYSRWDRCN